MVRPLERRVHGWALFALAALALFAMLQAGHQAAPPMTSKSATEAASAYGKLPLSFAANRGQTGTHVRYTARTAGFTSYFLDDKVVLDFAGPKHGVALALHFVHPSRRATLLGERRAAGTVNYISAGERHVNIPTYRALRYRDLWPGIDMVLRGSQGTLKYEFLVSPGADPSDIRLAYGGADGLSVGPAGQLRIRTARGSLTDAKPRSYQRIGTRKVPVKSSFTLKGKRSYGFAVPERAPGRPLVIDPGLVYSTYLGGSDLDGGTLGGAAIAVDSQGHAYVTGFTRSTDFPTTAGAYDVSGDGFDSAFVTKLSQDGSSLVYSTFLGNSQTFGNGIAVDSQGQAYVTGQTSSTIFPTTPGALKQALTGTSDGFVTKLNSSGSGLVYSTLVGGSGRDVANAIALDSQGDAHLTGQTGSGDFPVTPGAPQSNCVHCAQFPNSPGPAFIAKLNQTGSALDYATYVGGGERSGDRGLGIAVDATGSAYVAGDTQSEFVFPTTPGAYDTTFNGGTPCTPQICSDGFAIKMNPAGTAFTYSTFLGGSDNDNAYAIAIDPGGNAYVVGRALSADFLPTPGAYNAGGTDFLVKLNPAGSGLIYSARVGAGTLRGVAVDTSGSPYVTGETSSGFATSPDASQTTWGGSSDALLAKLTPDGSSLLYGSFLGGQDYDGGWAIALDGERNAYIAGSAKSRNFPTTPGAFDTTFNDPQQNMFQSDTFVSKFSTVPGFPRPKGATPLRASLTIAYQPCNSPNRDHGPPLVTGSCSPPQMASQYLTVGTGDANGMLPRSEGGVRFDVVVDKPATPADESDVKMKLDMSDVFTKALADYAGELRASVSVQLTDKVSTPGPVAATAVPFNLGFSAPCTPTADATVGSVCGATTTANAVAPGLVVGGNRALWQLGQVEVYDGGSDSDGDTLADNTLFANEGVFAP